MFISWQAGKNEDEKMKKPSALIGITMKLYKIMYDKDKCGGEGECSKLLPGFWNILENGKAVLKGSSFNQISKTYELLIDSKIVEIQKAVVGICPKGCIKLIELF